MRMTKLISVSVALLAVMAGRAGDSAPLTIDLRETRIADSLTLNWDASWVGGDAGATVVIADNGTEVKRATGVGEFEYALPSTGRHELTYTTYINGDAQDEVYRAVVYKGKYTVHFDSNGGEGTMDDREYVIGMLSALPQGTFSKDGYFLFGWALTPGGEATLLDGDSTADIVAAQGETVTLYAVWHEGSGGGNGLSVKYYDISSSGYSTWTQSEAAMTNYFASRTPTLEASTIDWGDTLQSGFQEDGDLAIHFPDFTGLLTDKSKTNRYHGKYANWSQEYFAMLFTGNLVVNSKGMYSFGASCDDEIVLYIDGTLVCSTSSWTSPSTGAISLEKGNHRIAIATYEFAGSQGMIVEWKKPGDSYFSPLPQSVLGDVNPAYAIRFEANYGEGSMSKRVYALGDDVTLPAVAFARDGWTFVGWAAEPDGLALYADGGTIEGGLDAANGETVTLYARWAQSQYAVRFDANGGEGTMEDESFWLGFPGWLSSNAFSRTGYDFAGWATAADGAAEYGDKSLVTNLTEVANAVVDLYAVWSPIQYEVRFNANGGSGSMATQILTYDAAVSLISNTFTKVGYSIAGWAAEADGDVIYNDGAEVLNLACERNAIVDLYAIWAPNEYEVTFDALDGEELLSTIVAFDSTYGELPTASCEGYLFLGWLLDGVNVVDSTSTVKTANNHKLTAKWAIEIGGGAIELMIGEDSVTLGAQVSAPSGDVIVPSEIMGRPVVGISNGAFAGCGSLTSVTIGDGVTSIGADAFSCCSGLTSVSIPNSVTKIGRGAFDGCVSLRTLAIPQVLCNENFQSYFPDSWDMVTDLAVQEGATRIGEWAFEGCAFTRVVLPSTLQVIEDGAFGSCVNLVDVSIPASVESIGDCVFEYCTSLPEIKVDIANEHYKDVDGVLYTKDGMELLVCPAGKRVSSCVIPDNVAYVHEGAFSYCHGLQDIHVQEGNEDYISVDGVLFSADGGTLVQYPAGRVGSYAIPQGVTEIGASAFAGCKGLTLIMLPDGLETIGELAFDECIMLESIDIPDSVEWMGDNAFVGCTGLGRVRMSANVNYLGEEDSPFSECDAIREVAIPQFVLNRLSYVFPDSYRKIEEIVVIGAVSGVDSSVFYGCGSLKRVVFDESVDSIANWNASVSLVVFEGHPPSGLAESGLISRAGSVSYKHEYNEEFRSIVGDDKFDGFPLEFEGVEFKMGRDGVWIQDGDSLRSGDTGDNMVSWLQTTVSGKGHVSFWWKVSSEHYGGEIFDYACFIVDGVTNAVFGGEQDWTCVEYDFVGNGTHVLRWIYVKDGEDDPALGQGDDCVWVKDLVWSPRVDVSFSINGGTGPVPAAVTVYVGSAITLPSADGLEREDHVFSGWSDRVATYDAGAEFIVPAESMTLVAQWTRKTFVSFDLGGGSGDMPQTIKELAGDVAVLPSADGLEREDHVFAGWSDGETAYDAGSCYTVPNVDVTLVAQWTRKTFVSFNLGGGSGDMPQTIKELAGDVAVLPSADGLEREDHVFAGWSDGDTIYNAGAVYTVPANDITITALWTRKTFVSFVGDVEDVVGILPSVAKALAGEKVKLPSADGFSRAKYTFAGWSDGENVYEAGAEYEFPSSDVTLVAVWTANTLSAPVISSDDVVGGGTIESEFAVIKIVAEDGVRIYYTLDGSEPTEEGGILYESAFQASAMNVTVKAMAAKDNHFNSVVSEFSFERLPFSAAECLGVDGVDITLGGDAEWFRVLGDAAHDGVAALRSGAIDHNESTWVEIRVEGEGQIEFWWKVSSERTVKGIRRDGCAFVIDGVEHAYMDNKTNDWTRMACSIKGGGNHIFKWIYSKNGGIVDGEDCAWLDEVVWTPSGPVIEGDAEATIEGDSETGYTIKPSEGNKEVVVTIPDGVEPSKVTVEVAATVETVTANGANIRVMKGEYDIAEHLDLAAATQDGVINLTSAQVKEEVVKEALDTEKGAEVDISDPESPELTTTETKPGLTYTLLEGATLEEMMSCTTGDSKVGDGEKWTPEIKVKGGTSGFYTIKVEK